MKVQTITFCASSLSGIVLIICMLAMYNIHATVKNIWAEFDGEMDEFKIFTNNLWRDIRNLSDRKRTTRAKRADQYESSGIDTPISQNLPPLVNSNPIGVLPPAFTNKGSPPGTIGILSDFCKCRSGLDNKCQPGVSGPKGQPGSPGKDGYDGIPGVPGVDALDYTPETNHGSICFNCPPGPIGPPGSDGKRGLRGRSGSAGRPGMQGHDGQAGSPGEPGSPGPRGLAGPSGLPGARGEDGKRPIGRPGPKGGLGSAGPPGPIGSPGSDAGPGSRGKVGLPGVKGVPGLPGDRGPTGEEGPEGRVGADAHYCQCPNRAPGSYGTNRQSQQQNPYSLLQ